MTGRMITVTMTRKYLLNNFVTFWTKQSSLKKKTLASNNIKKKQKKKS